MHARRNRIVSSLARDFSTKNSGNILAAMKSAPQFEVLLLPSFLCLTGKTVMLVGGMLSPALVNLPN